VEEYLTEKEQIEQIRQWWRENRWYLIGGALIAGIGYFGYNQYQAWQTGKAEAASSIYQELKLVLEDDDRDSADDLLARLEAEHSSSPYLDQARFLIAQDNLIRDTARSISELEAVVAGSKDEYLVKVARTRLARVLAYDEQFDRALAVLNVDDTSDFEPRFSEIRGDIHAAMGNSEAAIEAYTDALLGAANGVINRELIQLKLEDLIQSQSAGTGAAE